MDKNFTIRIVATDQLKTVSQQLIINFDNQAPTIDQNVPDIQSQLSNLTIDQKP